MNFLCLFFLNSLDILNLFKLKGNAIKEKRNLDEDLQYSFGIEYAKNRVNSTKNKLDGINPCVIVRDDLMGGIHKVSKYLDAYVNVALGINETDKNSELVYERARILKEKGEKYRLTTEEQVRCIIEQSMDPNILGRMYYGWQPYV